MNVVKNTKKGDIFYSEINKRFYFMQIIHITRATELSAEYRNSINDYKFNYGYFIVVFDKSFSVLPTTLKELDLNTVYRIKDRPKNSILYISHWSETREIKVKMDRIDCKIHAKYKLVHFGNTKISNSFEPKIIKSFTMSGSCQFDKNRICITASPGDINWVYRCILQDQKKQLKKKKNIQPKYFKDWLEYVDDELIVKTEKIITTFELEAKTQDLKKTLKKCILALNKLNDKENFIMTIEAEHLFDTLIELSVKFGFPENVADEIIENNRDW